MPLPRRKAKFLSEPRTFAYDHASVSASASVKLWTVPAGRSYRIARVVYNNPTGLASNGVNYFTINVLNAALVSASRATSAASLGADAPIEMPISATPANAVLPAGTTLSINLALTGAATLPAGRVVIEGDLI